MVLSNNEVCAKMGLFITTTIFVTTFHNHIMTIMTNFGVWNLGTEYGPFCAYRVLLCICILYPIYQVDILHFKLLENWISN